MSDVEKRGVDAPDTGPVAYIDRTHAYYAAQGFSQPYAYAHHDQAPFAPLDKALADCTLGLITTACSYPRAPLEPRRIESVATTPAPGRLYTADLSWDKQATHTDDVESFCPLGALRTLAEEGTIAALAPRFHCAPTEYSQRNTWNHDAPEILGRLRSDGCDVALLVPL